MSKSNQTRPQSQQPRSQNVYARMGRPFTLRDISPGLAGSTYDAARLQDSAIADDSLKSLSSARNKEYSGRTCHRFQHTPKDCLAKLQNSQLYASHQSTQLANSWNDSSHYACQCAAKRAARQQSPFTDEPANRRTRAQKLQQLKQLSQTDERINLQREMAKNKEIAMQRLRKEQHCPAREASPRQMSLERDLRYRCLTPATSAKQRARSCPTPCGRSHSSVQRMPKVSWGSVDTKRTCPSGFISPTVARCGETSENQSSKRSMRKRQDNLTRPGSSPAPSPACQSNNAGTLVMAAASTRPPATKTNQNHLPVRSPQTLPDGFPSKTDPAVLQKEQNQMTNTTSNQTIPPVDSPASLTYNNQQGTPRQQESVLTITNDAAVNRVVTYPENDSDSPALDSNNERIQMQGMYGSVDPNMGSSRQSPIPSPQTCRPEKSYTYNRTVLDAPNQCERRPNQVTGSSYGNKTQCVFDDMDISTQDFPSQFACPLPTAECSKAGFWKIPQEDMTCMDRSQASQQTFCPPSTMQNISASCDTLDSEFDSTQYFEVPSRLQAASYAPPAGRPCQQPKAMPHRSLEASQRQVLDQTLGQISAEWTFGSPGLCSTAIFGDLFDSPGNEAANEIPASVKDCANAKRCGRIPFDRSDKQELQDPRRRALRQAEIDALVNDTYCPGLIQETIDGRENFNKYTFNISDSGRGVRDPLTLLEAFSLRIDKEKTEIMKILKEDFSAKQITEVIEQHFATQNPTDLNRAIKCFLLAEQLQEHEDAQKAKGSSFEAEVQKWVTAWPGGGNMKLISYTGRTRPLTKAEQTSAQSKSD